MRPAAAGRAACGAPESEIIIITFIRHTVTEPQRVFGIATQRHGHSGVATCSRVMHFIYVRARNEPVRGAEAVLPVSS